MEPAGGECRPRDLDRPGHAARAGRRAAARPQVVADRVEDRCSPGRIDRSVHDLDGDHGVVRHAQPEAQLPGHATARLHRLPVHGHRQGHPDGKADLLLSRDEVQPRPQRLRPRAESLPQDRTTPEPRLRLGAGEGRDIGCRPGDLELEVPDPGQVEPLVVDHLDRRPVEAEADPHALRVGDGSGEAGLDAPRSVQDALDVDGHRDGVGLRRELHGRGLLGGPSGRHRPQRQRGHGGAGPHAAEHRAVGHGGNPRSRHQFPLPVTRSGRSSAALQTAGRPSPAGRSCPGRPRSRCRRRSRPRGSSR